MNPVKGGVRRARTRAPTMSGTSDDSSIIKYNVLGRTQTGVQITGSSPAVFVGGDLRVYAPGYSYGVVNTIGTDIVSSYSTGKFLPGTKLRWEPSVSFTTSGRIFCGFTDNPEMAANLATALATFNGAPTTANYNAYADQVKGLGSTRSWPIWQETEVTFPTKLRRKRFDCNLNVTTNTVDVLDRSAQTSMFICFDGMGSTGGAYGSFWYHDVVDVEGVSPNVT